MRIAKSSIGLALAASAAASAAFAADPEPSVAAFEAAMRDLDYGRASGIADALASRHRLDQKEPKPDVLLSGIVGRLFLKRGLPRDSCAVAETSPELKEHGIDDDDYPPDALGPSLAGATVMELDLGADGRVVASRIVLAMPSLVFDPLIRAKLPGFDMTPARERGRPRACRALQQTIRWRMPEHEAGGPPRFAPGPEEET